MFIFRFPVLPCKRANDIQPTWYITVFFVYHFGIFQWILFYLREYQHLYTPCISLCIWKSHKFCSSINDSNKPMHIRKIYMHTSLHCTLAIYFCYNKFLHSQKHSPRDISLFSCHKDLHLDSDRTNSCSYFHKLSHCILEIKNPLFKVQS